jgi:hypothetical protein
MKEKKQGYTQALYIYIKEKYVWISLKNILSLLLNSLVDKWLCIYGILCIKRKTWVFSL